MEHYILRYGLSQKALNYALDSKISYGSADSILSALYAVALVYN